MNKKRWFSIVLCLFLTIKTKDTAFAHEPLWGESAQTFAFNIWHPEIRFGFTNADSLFANGKKVANPDNMRMTRLEGLFSLQYAPKTALNVKIEVPFAHVSNQQKINGTLQKSNSTGLGDIVLSAKTRFNERFGEDWKLHQALTAGLQLPTGTHNAKMPNGELLLPSEQAGSGKWGVLLGYSIAYERLQDITWFSIHYQADFGGSGRRGARWQADLTYGYWFVRSKRPEDTGFILGVGFHIESIGRDRLANGSAINSGYNLLGWQTNFIVTKGQSQFRVGVLVPLDKRVNGTQLFPEWQIRAGWEILL